MDEAVARRPRSPPHLPLLEAPVAILRPQTRAGGVAPGALMCSSTGSRGVPR